jgi:hypothetical protein
MKQARIMTPWSETIDPENILPEYPRPQMVRGNWMNLNGIWDFTQASASSTYQPQQAYDSKILVPFPMESALSGLMRTDWDNQYGGKKYIYRRFFTLPESMAGKKILLHFGAVGYLSEVWINGVKAGTHLGEYDPFYFDITGHLKASGEQEVAVLVQDYQNQGGTPTGKQKINGKTIWYTPVTGIWQTVWLEAVSNVYIKDLALTPDIDRGEINIAAFASSALAEYTVKLEIYDGETPVYSADNLPVGQNKAAPIPGAKLWSPDSPFLYNLKVTLYENGQLIDAVNSYFGMRKISMGKLGGRSCLLLNNEYVFQQGVLDQGFWPDGIYTAPSDEALKFDLEVIKKFGMNMTRKHIKVEPARWYYHCDRLGLLVWQDMPNASGNPKYPGMGTKQDNFHRELKLMLDNLKNHPSIVMWVLYNEGWDQPGDMSIVRQGVDMMREADSTRIVSAASGWFDLEYGDIKDTHWYPAPDLYPNPENRRAVVCGEYGGITLRISDHQWLGGSNMQYTKVESSEELKNRFNEYLDRIHDLGANGICAAVYTQITDVEDEENGLITYDRKVVKVDETQMKAIADKVKHNSDYGIVEVLPTSRDHASTWKYLKSDTPLPNLTWANVDFDDSDWEPGTAPFGNKITVHNDKNDSYVINNWTNKNIYLRRTIEFSDLLTADNLDKLRAVVFHDEDCQVFLNGVLIGQWTGYLTNYQSKSLNMDQVKQALKIGEPNVLAVSCKQTSGGQFIDIGFCLYDVERRQYMTESTGIHAPAAQKPKTGGMRLFPNPAKTGFSLVVDDDEFVSSVSLMDITGKLVKRFPVQPHYNIRDIAGGMYIVTAKTDSQQYSSRLLITNER